VFFSLFFRLFVLPNPSQTACDGFVTDSPVLACFGRQYVFADGISVTDL
jgi:hypothetical protein